MLDGSYTIKAALHFPRPRDPYVVDKILSNFDISSKKKKKLAVPFVDHLNTITKRFSYF